MTNCLVHKNVVRQPLNYWTYGQLHCLPGRNCIPPDHLKFKKNDARICLVFLPDFSVSDYSYCTEVLHALMSFSGSSCNSLVLSAEQHVILSIYVEV
jgi:hypothetical protein